MLRILLVLISFPISAFAQDLDRSRIARFWEYIEENEALLSSKRDIVTMFGEIEHQLDEVHEDLVFEFSSEAVTEHLDTS